MSFKLKVNIIEAGDDDWQMPFVKFEIPVGCLRNSGKQFVIHFSDRDEVKELAEHLYKKATITIEVDE